MRQVVAAMLCAMAAGVAGAQGTNCPKPLEVTAPQLFGLWHAEVEGLAQGATLLFEKHPDYADSVAGGINRNGERGVISGEVEDGEFSLEESADGVHIAATWIGEIVDGSCGREIRGTWQRDGETRALPFRMKKR